MDLAAKHCLPCEGIGAVLDQKTVQEHLHALAEGWEVDAAFKKIHKKFNFKNFYHTMAFVNAIAWDAHLENHHPNLEISYNVCTVHFTTHAIGGLSMNDFICAAKVDKVFQSYTEKFYERK